MKKSDFSDAMTIQAYGGVAIKKFALTTVGNSRLKYNQTVVKSQVNGRIDASAVLVNDTSETVEKDVAWCVEDASGNAVARAESRG